MTRRGVRGLIRPALVAWMVAAAAGALQTLAYVHTAAWALQMLSVALLALWATRATPRRAALLGLVFGTAWLAAGTWWLFISLHRYGGLPAWMATLSVAALSALLSIYLAAGLAAFAAWRRGRPAVDALLFAALWLLVELARGVLFTGFPWVASGYAHVDGPLAPLAPWVGVYGIGSLAAGLSAWPALAWAGHGTLVHRGGPALVVAAVLVVTGVLPTAQFTRATGTLSVTLLQGNVPQDEKFEVTQQVAALEWHLTALAAATTDLVIAPETSIPFLPQQMPEGVWTGLQARFRNGSTAALVGVPLGDDLQGYTNSVAGFAPGQPALYRYDKQHLVPFGEFIPWGFRWFTQLMSIPLGDFTRGPLVAPSFVVKGERVGPNVCYEDLFGEELAARYTGQGDAPTVLANLSNIGWFGESSAVEQHLQISRMRTLELQRPMLRATNTGATVVIDHRAQVRHALAPHTRGVLEATVQGRDGLTPFARWAGAFGLWPPALLAAVTVAAFAAAAGAVRRARNGRREARP
jgi:apolipoprotein N-acyltransferase